MSDLDFLTTLNKAVESQELPQKTYRVFRQLYESYAHSLELSGFRMRDFDHLFEAFLMLVVKHLREPFTFESFHERIVQPYNYFAFGVEFIRPLVDREHSQILGMRVVEKISQQIEQNENAILFANHQTEVDPQLMSLILEDTPYSTLGENVIFVAGDRVLTDPMAVPFSMGRNLLCIYSKRHIDNPPEKKEEKLKHNQRTMHRMKELLTEGRKLIYVAPSGGRDRADEKGDVEVAPFDAQSIEMFRLMAKQSGQATHFYPLSLLTYDILPPPPAVELELGEMRKAKREGVLFAFGEEIDMESFPGSELSDRHEKRSARAQYIWHLVAKNYASLLTQRGRNHS